MSSKLPTNTLLSVTCILLAAAFIFISSGVQFYKAPSDLFGPVDIQPYTGEWIKDYPNLKTHIDTEQLLHVRGCDEEGNGLNWTANKFKWDLNPQYNPEKHFQMKLGYFIVPPEHIETFKSTSLSPSILSELEVISSSGQFVGYRFFVHPEAYTHFQALHAAGIPYVKSEDSEYMATPSSSYRSLVVRRVVPLSDTMPFIVKLGVGSPNNLNHKRLLSKSEVIKSINEQNNFNKMDSNPALWVFQENLGIVLKNIPNYPSLEYENSIESGIIIREFPQDLLSGKYQFYSFSALMSLERLSYPGIGFEGSIDQLPIIYELINSAIENGSVKSAKEYIHRYLIINVLKALESVIFEERLSLSIHGQNLCLVIDKNNLPVGIAIRDLVDVHHVERFIETYTWFYRYHIFIKLMNVLVDHPDYYLPSLSGAPIQKGEILPILERNLKTYLTNNLCGSASKTTLKNIGISFEEYNELLNCLDETFLYLLSQHFDISDICPKLTIGTLPSAEIGTPNQKKLLVLNKSIFNSKKTNLRNQPCSYHSNWCSISTNKKSQANQLSLKGKN